MLTKTYLKLFLIFLFYSVSDVRAEINNVSLEQLSVADGLSQGTVNTIFQDKTGYIWLGTENGIDIYDGFKVRPLQGPDNDFSSFSGGMIKQDSNGLMWLNVVGKGLYTFDVTTNYYQLIFEKDPNNKENFIVDVLEAGNDNYWIATSKSLIFYNKKSKKQVEKVNLSEQLLAFDTIFKISINKGVVYLATRVGVFVYHIEKEILKKLPDISATRAATNEFNKDEAKKTYTFHIDKETLFFGTNDGVFSLNISKVNQFLTADGQLPLYELLIQDLAVWQIVAYKNELFISSDKGLSVIDLTTRKSEFLFGLADSSEHITDNKIISLMIDKQGVFWLGSNSLGLFSWNSKSTLVKNFRYQRYAKNSLSHNAVYHISQEKNDNNILWVATENGINRVNITTNEVENFLVTSDTKTTYNQSNILNIVEDNQQRLWLTTSLGIVLFDLKSQKLVDLPFSDAVNKRLQLNVFTMDIDEQQRLWYLDEKSLQFISLITGEVNELVELNSSFAKDPIWNILGFLPESQKLFFSTNNALWQYDIENAQVKLLYKHAGIAESEWSYIDSLQLIDNTLWLAFTGKGIVGLSYDTFELEHFFHTSNSIIDNNVYGVMADENGNLWFSSHQGLFELNTQSFHLRQFTIKDGFPAMEYNAGAYTKLDDNRLVYGSMEGISIFDPIKLTDVNNTDFNVYISDVEVLSRQLKHSFVINNNDTINLAYDDVGIHIDFSTFSYLYNEHVIFEYKLIGETDVDSPPTRESYITFPTLSSGKHRLAVIATSPITGSRSEPVYLTLNVSYAPWRSPLAYIFYALLILLLGFMWFNYRKKQRQLLIEAHEQVKYRENRLQLALTGSNSEVWDWQAEDNLMFGKRISLELGYKNEALFYPFTEHVNLIHPLDKQDFISKWQLFIEASNLDNNFSCTYRLRGIDGSWLWYKDLGKIVAVDSSNRPIRITGSYTNITESRANEERAQFYGDAFKHTKDWVFIIDGSISRVTVNQSMRDVFGWQAEKFDFQADILGINKDRQVFYAELLNSLSYGENWRGEELITTLKGDEYHVIVNVSVGKNNLSDELHYIFVLTDISAQKNAENELRLLANYDHLTGLPNRSLLLDRIEHAIEHSNRVGEPIALFFIDLDRFKQVNDSLGHDYGDLLLKELTQRLTKVLRSDDTVARIGGDEFVVLLESFSNSNQLGHVAQKIIEAIGEPVQLKSNVVSVGASIGIALYPNDANDSDQLLRNADVAMYHAKQVGRNNFQFFTSQMNIEAKTRLGNESKLKQAVINQEFINYYQPIINSTKGEIVGFEMLMRWDSPEGLIMPGDFIPLAEELGLIIPMTEMALEQGFKQLKKWRLTNPDLCLSVNLAVQHFAKELFAGYVEELLKAFDLPASALRIEVTESALISEPEKSINTMCALSKQGVKLSLDDFGTGYSSLSYLKKLPLDVIKIDRSFVSGIGQSEADEAIVDTTLVLAKRLNMYCIAEGVETVEQLQYLTRKKCQYIQGYLYSKPIPAQEVTERLLSSEQFYTVTK